jgi:hypothetical protein
MAQPNEMTIEALPRSSADNGRDLVHHHERYVIHYLYTFNKIPECAQYRELLRNI